MYFSVATQLVIAAPGRQSWVRARSMTPARASAGLHQIGDGPVVNGKDHPTRVYERARAVNASDASLADPQSLRAGHQVGMEQPERVTCQAGTPARECGSLRKRKGLWPAQTRDGALLGGGRRPRRIRPEARVHATGLAGPVLRRTFHRCDWAAVV
jgi:hypothetical protein